MDLNGSAYPESRQVTLNVYDKHDQVEKELQNVPMYPELLVAAENIFRVEVQCYRGKVKALRRKYRLPNTQLGHFLNEQIAKDTVLYYYGLMFGYQDFYSLAETDKIVDAQPWRTDHKKHFKDRLRAIVAAGSFTAAREAFSGSRSMMDSFMKDSRDIGVNPITLPDEWGLAYLPNPMPDDYRPE